MNTKSFRLLQYDVLVSGLRLVRRNYAYSNEIRTAANELLEEALQLRRNYLRTPEVPLKEKAIAHENCL